MPSNHSMRVSAAMVCITATAVGLMSASGHAQSSWNTTDGLWSMQSNWVGGLPGLLDDVFIGDTGIAENSEVILDIEELVNSLQITDGMMLRTNGRRLRVTESLDLFGRNVAMGQTFRSSLRVDAVAGNGIGVSTGRLRIGGGALETRSDSRAVISDALQLISDDAIIFNRGSIELIGDGTVLDNDGIITTLSGQSRIDAPNGFLNLDGVEGNGVLRASAVSLGGDSWGHTIIARGLTDSFDGSMRISGPNFIDMQLDEPWVLGNNGELDFSQGPEQIASSPTLRGSHVRIEGRIDSFADNARIEADTTIAPSARLHAFGADTHLFFFGNTVIEGGEFVVSGNSGEMRFLGETILQGGDFQAVQNSHFTFVDLTIAGGGDFDGEVRVTEGARVVLDTWELSNDPTINTDAIGHAIGDSPGRIIDHIFIGRNGLNPATWTVNLPEGDSYIIEGDVEIDHFEFGGGTTSIAGSDVAISGDIHSNGFTRFDARVDLIDNELFMEGGGLEFAGGSIENPNTLDDADFLSSSSYLYSAPAGVAVEGSGLFNGTLDFASGSALIATETEHSSQLTIVNPVLSMGSLGVQGDGARLVFSKPYDTGVGDELWLEGGQIYGSQIRNTNETGIRGHGALGISVENESVIAAEGGRLVIDNSLDDEFAFAPVNDLDGANDGGTLRAIDGSMTIVGESPDFRGTVEIALPHDLTLQDSAFTFAPDSIVDMRGGRIISEQLQTFSGDFRASEAAARLETDALFLAGSTNKIMSSVVLTQDTAIRAGAQFGNGGRLVNAASGELTLFDGANIGVDMSSAGIIILGDAFLNGGLGDAMISDDLFLSGRLMTDLTGDTEPLYDQLAIADTLTVRNAVFDVSFLNGFTAQAGDEFDILDFSVFEDLGYTLLLPELEAGLVWDSSDFETLGIIRVQVPTPGFATLILVAGLTGGRRRRMPRH